MELTELALLAYVTLALCLVASVWRRDKFFGIFFAMLVLYSVAAPFGYHYAPELSIVMVRMYFGPEVLASAIAFTAASLLTLFCGFLWIYLPLKEKVRIPAQTAAPSIPIYLAITTAQLALLAFGLIFYWSDLSYANAADVDFIERAGVPYKIFWNAFKFTPFSLIVLVAVFRTPPVPLGKNSKLALLGLLFGKSLLFLAIATASGNRTDLLSLVLGMLALEEYLRSSSSHLRSQSNSRTGEIKHEKKGSWRRFLGIMAALTITVAILTIIEYGRGGKTSDESLETDALTQAILVKDYYAPFHVLIGVIANEYIDPMVVLASNAANALMFLKVDYLQAYAVEQWDPGTVTRAASPAMFAFTEGYMFMGWGGFVYNGLIWTSGILLWRLMANTTHRGFNAVAFALPVAIAATVARAQSSYFIKDIYLSFAPALLLFCLANGARPRFLGQWTRTTSTRPVPAAAIDHRA